MFCDNCGGMLFVIRVEEPPEDLLKHKKLIYNRVCDVQCHNCGKTFYSQPYDFGRKLNIARKIKD